MTPMKRMARSSPLVHLRIPILFFLTLAFIISIPVFNTAGVISQSNNNVCIQGSVINADETAQGAGWAITATHVASGETIGATTDNNGKFTITIDLGTNTGEWQFSIDLDAAPDGKNYEAVTLTTFSAELDGPYDGCRTIRFKIREIVPPPTPTPPPPPRVKVNVLKIDQDHNPLPGWTIKASPGKGNSAPQSISAITDVSGTAMFSLTLGVWIFSESAPDGMEYEPIVPLTGKQSLNVVAPGPHSIRFKNRVGGPDGCLIVNKNDQQPNTATAGLVDWGIKVLRANGTVARSGYTDAFGSITFTGLPLGPYTVVEETRSGWTPVSPSKLTVPLENEECVTVTFVNRQSEPEFCIEGEVIDHNGKVGLPGWTVIARPLDKGGFDPGSTQTDAFGHYRFDLPLNDYRIPGARYEICEIVEDDWVNVSARCYRIRMWDEPTMCEEVPDFVNKQKRSKGWSNKGTTTSGNCSSIHVVRRGEGLYDIGRQYGRTAQQMLNANPWVRNQKHHYVYTGQKVCIP